MKKLINMKQQACISSLKRQLVILCSDNYKNDLWKMNYGIIVIHLKNSLVCGCNQSIWIW
jgi:hypothetical protein